MTAPEHFKMEDGYASYRPVGKVSLQEAVLLATNAITYARENQIRRLLINCTGLTGFGSPKTLDRFQMAEQWARAGQSMVKLSVVAAAELIDPEKFGMTVARNRGLLGNIFSDEAEALAWLLDPNAS